MKNVLVLATAAMIATPSLAAPIDGKWLGDPSSAQLSAKPKSRTLMNGVYRCPTCVPAYSLAADGKWHALKGDPYADEEMIKVVDARTITIDDRQHGKLVGSSTGTVAPDNKSMTWAWKNVSATGVVTTGEATDIRVAPGPKGAHVISGSWRNGKVAKIDSSALTINFKDEGGMLHMSAPTGEAYDARIGGPPVLVRNDAAGTMAAVRKTGANTYVETDTRAGKTVSVTTYTLVNPKTMNLTSVDTLRGRTTHFIAHKQ